MAGNKFNKFNILYLDSPTNQTNQQKHIDSCHSQRFDWQKQFELGAVQSTEWSYFSSGTLSDTVANHSVTYRMASDSGAECFLYSIYFKPQYVKAGREF